MGLVGHPSRVYQLLTVLQTYAPNGTAQQDCTDFVQAMYTDKCSETEIELAISSALVDGLRVGNWPWSIRRTTGYTVENDALKDDEIYVIADE